MADTRFPSFLRVAGSSSPPAANPQVERIIGVSDPYTLDVLDYLAGSEFTHDISEARQQRALLHRLIASLGSETVSDKARRAARARWAKEAKEET